MIKRKKRVLKTAFVATVTTVATSVAGGCLTQVSVNPPACEDGNCYVDECPSEVPDHGNACPASPGFVCDYEPDDDPCGSSSQAICGSDGLWQTTITTISCNPPPPCPDSLPLHNDPCELGFGVPENCSYTVMTSCGEVTVEPSCKPLLDTPDWYWEVILPSCQGTAEQCDSYGHADVCGADNACRWLHPGCFNEKETAAPAGCVPAEDCTETSCGNDESCITVIYDPCYQDWCDACGAEAQICLPDDG